MAVTVSTTRIGLDATKFRRGRPVLSGEGAADAPYGFDGIRADSNHGYAHRVQTIAGRFTLLNQTEWIAELTGPADGPICGEIDATLCADVAEIRAVIDIEDGYCRVCTDEADGSWSAHQTGRNYKTVTVALTDKTGANRQVWVEFKADALEIVKCYGYVIQEVPLLAADLPA